jgi:hypothetical protein
MNPRVMPEEGDDDDGDGEGGAEAARALLKAASTGNEEQVWHLVMCIPYKRACMYVYWG